MIPKHLSLSLLMVAGSVRIRYFLQTKRSRRAFLALKDGLSKSTIPMLVTLFAIVFLFANPTLKAQTGEAHRRLLYGSH